MQFFKKVHIVLKYFFENNPIISTFLVVHNVYQIVFKKSQWTCMRIAWHCQVLRLLQSRGTRFSLCSSLGLFNCPIYLNTSTLPKIKSPSAQSKIYIYSFKNSIPPMFMLNFNRFTTRF